MIVDDDKALLEELEGFLALSGYNVIAVTDGIEALQSVHKINPDVILLYIKMKEMYGFQIAEKLKRSPKTASIPIFAMTGYFTRKEDAQLMDLCGIEMCFEKPFNPLDLISKIEEILS